MDMKALNERQIGVTFGFRAKAGYYESKKAKEEADAIAAAGIKWVTLVATVFHENYSSLVQFIDFENSPTDLELIEMIEYFHNLGIKIQLRPMLEGLDGSDRIDTWFPHDHNERIPHCVTTHCSSWFRNMTARSVHYAKIAERTNCEMFCLDSEFDRITNYNEQWKGVIRAVREVYSGPVTSCHTCHTGLVDFDKAFRNKNHWFYDLDLLSMSCYQRAEDQPGATVGEMIGYLKPMHERFVGYAKEYGKPILLGECGCTSHTGAAMNPGGWSTDPVYDGMEQANYLEAIVETFRNDDWWRGLCWWKWDEQTDRPFLAKDPAGDSGFTPKGKPAIELFRRYNKEM